VATATKVGARRGQPVILTVAAARMHDEGRVFYVSTNGVWLTEHVPAEFIGWP
jgi:putative RNA 2'-phosphotransferase